MPEGHNADNLRKTALDHSTCRWARGSTKVAGKVFRIGHLGDTNDLTIIATLAGVRDGACARPACRTSRRVCAAAMDYFTEQAKHEASSLRRRGSMQSWCRECPPPRT